MSPSIERLRHWTHGEEMYFTTNSIFYIGSEERNRSQSKLSFSTFFKILLIIEMYSTSDVQILLQSCDFDYNRFCQIVRSDVNKDLMFIQSKHSLFLIDWFLLFEKMNKLNFWIRCIQKRNSI